MTDEAKTQAEAAGVDAQVELVEEHGGRRRSCRWPRSTTRASSWSAPTARARCKGAILGSTPHKLLHLAEVPVLVRPRPRLAVAVLDSPCEHLGQARRPAGARSTATRSRASSSRSGPEFTRFTTLITMTGGGEEGVGEDVVYDGLDHVASRTPAQVHDLSGPSTLGELAELLDTLDLFPAPPGARGVAQLPPLGVRVGGARPGAAPGAASRWARWWAASPRRSPTSSRCGWRTSTTRGPRPRTRCTGVLERYPRTRFKLDPTNAWTEELVAELAATGAVDSMDLKGHYNGHAGGRGHRPGAVPDGGRGPARRLARGPRPVRARGRRGAGAPPRPHHLGRADPLDRRHRGAAVPAEDGEHQAVADRAAQRALRRATTTARAGHRRLRRRAGRAGRGPRPHPVPGRDLPPGHAERHRPARVQHARPAGRAARRARGRCRSPRPASASREGPGQGVPRVHPAREPRGPGGRRGDRHRVRRCW